MNDGVECSGRGCGRRRTIRRRRKTCRAPLRTLLRRYASGFRCDGTEAEARRIRPAPPLRLLPACAPPRTPNRPSARTVGDRGCRNRPPHRRWHRPVRCQSATPCRSYALRDVRRCTSVPSAAADPNQYPRNIRTTRSTSSDAAGSRSEAVRIVRKSTTNSCQGNNDNEREPLAEFPRRADQQRWPTVGWLAK